MTEVDGIDEPEKRSDGRYVTWQGRTYRGSVQTPGTVTLLSPDPEEGFDPRPLGGGFQRTVPAPEVAAWSLRTTCRWRGALFVVMAAVGEELTLRYAGGSTVEARELGLTELERGVFSVTVPRSAVTDLVQTRTEGELA